VRSNKPLSATLDCFFTKDNDPEESLVYVLQNILNRLDHCAQFLLHLSITILLLVQTRVLRKDGWLALREKRMLDTYWKDLSVMERALLWPGILMFFLTLFGGTAWNLIMSLNS